MSRTSYHGSLKHLENMKNARLKTREKLKCQFCSNLFVRSNLSKHENSCYLNPLVMKLCIVCIKPIKNKGVVDQITCSYSCSNKYFRSGPNNPNWKESTYRTTCFHYHKMECVICQEQNIVEVHHLDENNKNNDPSNLIPLCPTHHQYWHSRFKYLVKDKILMYIENWRSPKASAMPD